MVDNLGIDVLRRLAAELLRRQPAVFADLVNGEMAVYGQLQPGPGAPQPPADDSPDLCNCGLCRVMPTQEENKCCCNTRMPCISIAPLFQQLVLDGNVLDLAMRYREEIDRYAVEFIDGFIELFLLYLRLSLCHDLVNSFGLFK